LDEVDDRYNVIEVAFAVPQAGTDYQMTFSPNWASRAQFISQIQDLQAQDKKVLISMGGGGTLVKLDHVSERDSFVSSMIRIVEDYGFDGIDMDFEGGSISLSGGSITAPVDTPIILMTEAIQQIMATYRARHGKKLLLTLAPETANVQGGQSQYRNAWGAYLPIIHALRDSIDMLQVQLYNSGTMYGIDRGIYSQGTADFLVALTEASIQGFNTNGGFFAGLPAEKIAVGLPACPSAAGGGYTPPTQVRAAMEYILGYGSQPGMYRLFETNGYPNLGGMMTWSINWDASSSCTSAYEYASIFESVFGDPLSLAENEWSSIQLYPNPTSNLLTVSLQGIAEVTHIQLSTPEGKLIRQLQANPHAEVQFDLSGLAAGIYYEVV